MSKIPADYLPPKELWAGYTAPEEFKQFTSGQWNIAEEFLDKHVKEGRGDQVAILFGDQKITYKELLAMSNKFANVLKKHRRRAPGPGGPPPDQHAGSRCHQFRHHEVRRHPGAHLPPVGQGRSGLCLE